MDAAQQAVADIVASRKAAPKKRKRAKKAQVASAPLVSDEGKRGADGRFVKGEKPPVGQPFAPGNPGGPGRPSLAAEILKVLAETDERTGKPNVHQVAVATVTLAKSGSLGHVQLIIDRTDGKIAQTVEVGNKPGETFEVSAADARGFLVGGIARLAAGIGEGAGDSEPE